MGWNRRYSLVSYLKSSLWVVPMLAIGAALALVRVTEAFETWFCGLGPGPGLALGAWRIDREEAAALLNRIFDLNQTCLVFAFGSLLVAIQVAGGQYTPRIIATTLLRDRVIRWIVGLFVFSMLWANRTLIRLDRGVPQLQVYLGAVFGLASLVAFILLIDYAARMLRPVSLAIRIGRQGVAVIESVYPALAGDGPEQRHPERPPDATAARVIPYRHRSAVVLAVNIPRLVREAARHDCVLELAAQVGDFVAVGEPLFLVHGAGADIDEKRLAEQVAMGSERTLEQDPMFAFRIVVDIALKALSPAINDPTTAVLAIDQVQRLLGLVGKRALHDCEIRDAAGRLRLILRTPDWEDFVHMSFREIRHYGADSVQVERRLRAMIDTLLATLPAHRHPALHTELSLLEAAAQRTRLFAADAALARIPDSQGLGGASGSREDASGGASGKRDASPP
ncbi:DUF2254 domain-containing protein [Massilia sp.]|uniref:DUF2254 domain-containing protein n=1 Tax=Massilia sp. TaxID=1882437 RepID=UPI0028AB2426|nr:DUF2254 domain-containing protein [Massilia sp.]